MNDLEILTDEQWVNLTGGQRNLVLSSITKPENVQEVNRLKEFLAEKVAIASVRPDDSKEMADLRNITESIKNEVEKEVVERFEKIGQLQRQTTEEPMDLNENLDVKELENRKIAIKKNLNIIYRRMIGTAETIDLTSLAKAKVETDLLPSFYKYDSLISNFFVHLVAPGSRVIYSVQAANVREF